MLTDRMTREVAVKTLLAKMSRDKFRKLSGEAPPPPTDNNNNDDDDDDDDDDDRRTTTASVTVESQQMIAAPKSLLVSDESIVDQVRHPPSIRVADYSNDATSRVNSIVVSSSSRRGSPKAVDSMHVVHAKQAVPSSLRSIDRSIIDPDELLVKRVLEDQERRFGMNMLDLITTNNPEVKRVMARRGCSKIDAMQEVFEKSAPATLGILNTQVRYMSPSQQHQQGSISTAQPGSPASKGSLLRRAVEASPDRPGYNSYSSQQARPTVRGGGGRSFNEAHLRELTSMGFSRQQSEAALSSCRYDVHAAIEYLLEHAT
jgi:hypothetical protein